MRTQIFAGGHVILKEKSWKNIYIYIEFTSYTNLPCRRSQSRHLPSLYFGSTISFCKAICSSYETASFERTTTTFTTLKGWKARRLSPPLAAVRKQKGLPLAESNLSEKLPRCRGQQGMLAKARHSCHLLPSWVFQTPRTRVLAHKI